ncbi:unnamed protein product [Lupinus luteus]|uniref:Transmembrane protein n=1 Tax=Lupinus luteus TaxID=3873 RepID=A0AAV1W749_LUPLU
MNVLDSSLQPLPFNYFFTFTSNNLWTCFALFTLSLTFCKFLSSSLHPKPVSELNPVLTTTEPVTEEPLLIEPVVQTEEVHGVRKGKVRVYYECECEKSELAMTVTEDWNEGVITEWWEKWEKVMRLRNGVNEKGWYTCQDLTELNGNVVRLWDKNLLSQTLYLHPRL